MYLRLGKKNQYIYYYVVKLPTPESDKTLEIYKYYKMVRYSSGDLCTVCINQDNRATYGGTDEWFWHMKYFELVNISNS